MTIYEYVSYMQPDIIEELKRLYKWQKPAGIYITFKQAISLMRHPKWKRINRRLRQTGW